VKKEKKERGGRKKPQGPLRRAPFDNLTTLTAAPALDRVVQAKRTAQPTQRLLWAEQQYYKV
jgi:hypothetical protein